MKAVNSDTLQRIYTDVEQCAELVGLCYTTDGQPGYGRQRSGKGFRYIDEQNHTISDKTIKQRLNQLVIPPAWQHVWISADENAHILATGLDDKNRKQYIYHPMWRKARDLLKFYRMITFGEQLPHIRKSIDLHLSDSDIGFDQIVAAMLWILDNTYIRIGNEVYFYENNSVGLTTLSDKNVVIDGDIVSLSFKGKSGKDHHLSFDHPQIAKIVQASRGIKGPRLFQYIDSTGTRLPVSANDINNYLHAIAGQNISAKDFRTWGGTYLAFVHLIKNHDSNRKPEKIAIDAIDSAAGILGNTCPVARASYIHPDLLESFTDDTFDKYYRASRQTQKKPGLDKHESELLAFLKILFEEEFELLQQSST